MSVLPPRSEPVVFVSYHRGVWPGTRQATAQHWWGQTATEQHVQAAGTAPCERARRHPRVRLCPELGVSMHSLDCIRLTSFLAGINAQQHIRFGKS